MTPGSFSRSRVLVIVVLVLAGLVLTLVPHWRRFGQRSVKPLVRTAAGKHPGAKSIPDTRLLLYRLSTVTDPEIGADLLQLGLVESLNLDTAGNVQVVLGLTTPLCPFVERLAQAVLDSLTATPGVKSVTVKVDPNLIIRR
ncbi:MAG: metal-sulfur cluster assembly factor [candidate division WOR-3 bacterium]